MLIPINIIKYITFTIIKISFTVKTSIISTHKNQNVINEIHRTVFRTYLCKFLLTLSSMLHIHIARAGKTIMKQLRKKISTC